MKKGAKGKKDKDGHSPKKSDSAQKDETIAMLKESLAEAHAENGKGGAGLEKLLQARNFDDQDGQDQKESTIAMLKEFLAKQQVARLRGDAPPLKHS